MPANFPLSDNIDAVVLYLQDIHHTGLAQLADTPSLELVQDCFEQFNTFLADTAPLAEWWADFTDYYRELLTWLARPDWHTDHCLRSAEFAWFVQSLAIGE